MLRIKKNGKLLLLILAIFSVSCVKNTKLLDVSTLDGNPITKKGLLVLSDERDRPDMFFDIFFPLQDTSFFLTNRNYILPGYDIGFSVGGIPQNVRNELMDSYGEKLNIYPYSIVLPVELTFEQSISFTENAIIDSLKLDLRFEQKWFYKKRTGVAYSDYAIIVDN